MRPQSDLNCARAMVGGVRLFKSAQERRAAFKAINNEYRTIKRRGAQLWSGLLKDGKVGSMSHRAGGHSFGATARKRGATLNDR